MLPKTILNLSQLLSTLETNSGPKNKPISICLYTQLDGLPPEKRDRAEEMILENFSFADGSYKKTHACRFDEFDNQIIALASQQFDKAKKIKIHDLAVSDGRTSLELFFKLGKVFPELVFYASDKNMSVNVFSDSQTEAKKIITDGQGKILQIILPPRVLNIYSSKRAWAYKIKKACLHPFDFFLTIFLLIPTFRKLFFKIDDSKKQTIVLAKKEVLEMTAAKNNFHLSEYDLFEKNSDQFGLIRAMNVLNPSYFSPEEAKKIITNIISSLAEGGLFAVGSNKEAASPVNGDIFAKKNGHFESLAKFGSGANFRNIMLAI
jgi:hypothetical protein